MTHPAAAPRAWRWFPRAMLAAVLAVFAVNGVMVTLALQSMPGAAGQDGFDLSNRYDALLAETGRQQHLGWKITADVDAGRHPRLTVTDQAGNALASADVHAEAERPVGPPTTTKLTLRPDGSGLVAAETLARGQWLIGITVTRGNERVSTTERMVVP